MIVLLFNEAITYVNQQTEEKNAKMLKRAQQESAIIMTQQTSCNHNFIKHLSHETRSLTFFFIVRFTLRREDKELKDDKLC